MVRCHHSPFFISVVIFGWYGPALIQEKQMTETVLIVDDAADTRFVLKAALSHDGYNAVTAENGQEALQKIEESPPDVILLDVMMPGMTGFEVCQLLKTDKRWEHIPVIMITALPGKKDLARGFEAGADDFVSKPFNNIEILARVRSMLRIKSQYDRLEQQRQELESTLQLREELARVTARRLEELEILHDIGLSLMNSLDANYMVEVVTQKVQELIPKAAHCVVHFLSDDEQFLAPMVFTDEATDETATDDINPLLGNEDLIRQAIDTKETVYVPDLLPYTSNTDFNVDRIYSLLAIPLVVDQRAIGVISIDSSEADAFEVADRRILSILSSQLAVSVMKARLFENLISGSSQREPKSRLQTTKIPTNDD